MTDSTTTPATKKGVMVLTPGDIFKGKDGRTYSTVRAAKDTAPESMCGWYKVRVLDQASELAWYYGDGLESVELLASA